MTLATVLASQLKTIDEYLISWLNELGAWGNLLLIFFYDTINKDRMSSVIKKFLFILERY